MRKTLYDAIVVGSGFGGSVMAKRLAEAGMRVCVFERGRRYLPGSFARSPEAVGKNFWEPSRGLQGLFDIWSFKGIDAVVASGVGGGSLIWSNVLLRKDERWFVHDPPGPDRVSSRSREHWPITRADLDRHYDEVEAVIGGQPYPIEHEPYASTRRMQTLREVAQLTGYEWLRPPLAVAFGNAGEAPRPGVPLRDRPGHNRAGTPRFTCMLCGECNFGCNFGSKQTLDLTYLSLAEEAGAEVMPRCEVRGFTRLGSGSYRVEYIEHSDGLAGCEYRRAEQPLQIATARYLVLAAGTLGTTFLLLRMKRDRPQFSGLSPALGTQFSGNGDLLSAAWRGHEATADGLQPRNVDPTFGPVITSAIRVPDALDRGDDPCDDERGFYVEDAGYPAILAWLLEFGPRPSTVGRMIQLGWDYTSRLIGLDGGPRLSLALSQFIGDGALTNSTLPLLTMGRDAPSGVISLSDHNLLDVDWSFEDSAGYIDRVRRVGQDIARALRATYGDNPLWRLKRVITVHPVGGVPMGEDWMHGVVDSYGRVFGQPGLYVADGSVLPGPVGANPAFTIAALAERFASQLIEEWRARR